MPCLPRPQSLAITFWGIVELIIKENGDEGSFPSHHSPLALYARSHHPPLALLAFLQLSRVPHWALGKPVKEADAMPPQVFVFHYKYVQTSKIEKLAFRALAFWSEWFALTKGWRWALEVHIITVVVFSPTTATSRFLKKLDPSFILCQYTRGALRGRDLT